MDIKLVESIPLFAGIPRRRHKDVASWADEVTVPPGTTLTRRDDHARAFYVIVSGSVALVRDGDTLAELESGDFFGELGMLSPTWQHTGTVVSTSTSHLLVLGRREFQAMMARLPKVAERVRREATVRARRTESGRLPLREVRALAGTA